MAVNENTHELATDSLLNILKAHFMSQIGPRGSWNERMVTDLFDSEWMATSKHLRTRRGKDPLKEIENWFNLTYNSK